MVYKTNFVLVAEGEGEEVEERRRVYKEKGEVQEKEEISFSTNSQSYGEEGEVQENEEISFSSKSQSYCVCFVSMVDSTETTLTINDPDKIRRYYYSIFINTMAAIAR